MLKFFKKNLLSYFLTFLLSTFLLSTSVSAFDGALLDNIKVDDKSKTVVNIAEAAKYDTKLQATEIVSRVVRVVLGLCSTIALGMIILAGYNYLMSKGDPAKIKKANGEIITGFIGISLIVLSYSISNFIIQELVKRSTVNSTPVVVDVCNSYTAAECSAHSDVCHYNGSSCVKNASN